MINLVTLDFLLLSFILAGLLVLLLAQIFFFKSFDNVKKKVFIFSILFSLIPVILSIFINQYYLAGTGFALRYGWPSAFIRSWLSEIYLSSSDNLLTLLFSNLKYVSFMPLQFIANVLFYSLIVLNLFGLVKKFIKKN